MNSVNKVENKIDQLVAYLLSQWQLLLLIFLFVSVVFISIKIVVQRHEARVAYMELQTHEKERDKLAAQWSRLKLEQATTLNQVRVEQYARWDLGMKMPKASEVKIIQERQAEILAVGDVSEVSGVREMKVSTSVTESLTSSKMALGN